jgi:hypothetical protein
MVAPETGLNRRRQGLGAFLKAPSPQDACARAHAHTHTHTHTQKRTYTCERARTRTHRVPRARKQQLAGVWVLKMEGERGACRGPPRAQQRSSVVCLERGGGVARWPPGPRPDRPCERSFSLGPGMYTLSVKRLCEKERGRGRCGVGRGVRRRRPGRERGKRRAGHAEGCVWHRRPLLRRPLLRKHAQASYSAGVPPLRVG